MPTFSNSPIPREEEPKAVAAEEILPPSEETETVTDTAEEVMSTLEGMNFTMQGVKAK